jgi:hypothetical protein
MDVALFCSAADAKRVQVVSYDVEVKLFGQFREVYVSVGSRDSSVGIATGYGLDDRGAGVRVPVESRIFLLHVVQTGSGVHPASCPMGTGGSFPGGKTAGE